MRLNNVLEEIDRVCEQIATEQDFEKKTKLIGETESEIKDLMYQVFSRLRNVAELPQSEPADRTLTFGCCKSGDFSVTVKARGAEIALMNASDLLGKVIDFAVKNNVSSESIDTVGLGELRSQFGVISLTIVEFCNQFHYLSSQGENPLVKLCVFKFARDIINTFNGVDNIHS